MQSECTWKPRKMPIQIGDKKMSENANLGWRQENIEFRSNQFWSFKWAILYRSKKKIQLTCIYIVLLNLYRSLLWFINNPRLQFNAVICLPNHHSNCLLFSRNYFPAKEYIFIDLVIIVGKMAFVLFFFSFKIDVLLKKWLYIYWSSYWFEIYYIIEKLILVLK